MQTKRLKQNKLHKQFLKCFGSLTNSARALRYGGKDSFYKFVRGTTKWPNDKKMAKGFEEHDKDIAELKKMLDLD